MPRQRKKKVPVVSRSYQASSHSNSSPDSTSPPASLYLQAYSRHHTPGFQETAGAHGLELNHIFQSPQIHKLDPEHVIQMFMFYSQPTSTSVQPFRPFHFSIIHAVADRARSSSLMLKSTYVGARIKKAISDGAGLSIGVRLIDDFQRQITNTTLTPDMDPAKIATLFDCLLGLVLALLQIVNTPIAHSLLRKSVPFFLALAAKYPELWADDLSISIRHAFIGLRFEFSHFTFLDTITALVFGTIPLIHYDITLSPVLQSPTQFYMEWAHGCSPIVVVLLARVNSWRAARLIDPTHPLPTLEQQQEFQACLKKWNPTIGYDGQPALVMGRLAVQECWKHGVLIYMYMGMCEADTTDPRVEASVCQVAQLSSTIEANSSLEAHMTIPCIIAAVAARKEKHRAVLRKKVVVSRDDRVCLVRGADFVPVLDHLWHGAAAGGCPTTWQDYVNSRFAVLPITDLNPTTSPDAGVSNRRVKPKINQGNDTPALVETLLTLQPLYEMDLLKDAKPSNADEWISLAQTKFSDVIRGLADIQPGLLEFLMSANEGIRSSVRSSLCGVAFPTTRALWLNSISCSLFQRFLAYFNRLPSNLNLIDRSIDDACRQVMPYMVLLSALGQIQFTSPDLEEPTSRKWEARGTMCPCQSASTVNPQLFSALDLQYPTTPKELQEVETLLLQRLEMLLGLLIDAFGNPKLGVYSRTLVFDTPQEISQESTLLVTTDSSNEKRKTQIVERPGILDDMAQLGSKPVSTVVSGLDPAAGGLDLLSPSPGTDWETTGRSFFDKRHYSQAIICFEKANLLVERDIATAYESRKQATLLQVAPTFDQSACCAAFTKAAADFLGCATLTQDKQQMACYLHAAECHLQAEDWIAAAQAYSAANDFDMAARVFLREGSIDEAVKVVKKHRDDMRKKITEEIFGIARLEYFRTNQLEKASELFDGVDEQLEYMENYGFTIALIPVLEHHKCYDQARKTIEQALRGLWKLLPFGFSGTKRQTPAIDLFINQLSGSKMLKSEESREASEIHLKAFQALRANDLDSLLALAQSSEKTALDSGRETLSSSTLPLLCFSHSSRLLVPRRNSTIPEFIQKAKIALSYIGHLLQFARSLDVSSPNTQKLLAFEPMESTELGEGKSHSAEFWIYSTSLMFDSAQKILGDTVVPVSSALGLSSLAITELDTRRLASTALYDAARSEVRTMHNSANLGWYLYPCLDFAIFGRCNRSECGRQEVNSRDLPNERRQELFNQRTRGLIIQIQIVHGYQVHSYQNEYERRDFRRIWACRLYENLMPHFPPLGNVVCVDPKRIPELAGSTYTISAWCKDALNDLDPGFGPPNRFLSDVLAYLDISFRINRQDYIVKLHSRKLVRPRDDLMIERLGPVPGKYSIVHDFINLYARRSPDVISRAIRAVYHIVFKSLAIEANVLVNLLEFVGREIIVQWRMYQSGDDDVFDKLMVPRSWAYDLVKHAPLPIQQGISLGDYLAILYKVLELLRSHDTGSSPFYGFSGPPGLLVRGVLIMRVCRLIVLVVYNTSVPPLAKEDICRTIARSLNVSGDIHHFLCAKFLRVDSWHELWNAVRCSPLNRGADELVYLFRYREGQNPPTIGLVRPLAYKNINPELARLLSLVEPDATPNPQTEPSVPQTQNHLYTDAGSATIKLTQTTAANGADASESPNLIKSEGNFPSASQIEPKRSLTISEIKSGTKILLCYKRYRIKKSVKKIWACYLRYRLRDESPMTETEKEIRKLHEEYKNDVESIDCPLLCIKAFQTHERILLGLMPHILVYLRGLETVNQEQKQVTVQRLPTATYAELDNIRIRMDVCLASAKKIQLLMLRIAPGSRALHHIDTLREEVKQVDLLRSEIRHTFGEDAIPKFLEEHYTLGISVILPTSGNININ